MLSKNKTKNGIDMRKLYKKAPPQKTTKNTKQKQILIKTEDE